MQLTVKYHGELSSYFPDNGDENVARIEIDDTDSVRSVIDKLSIPHEKINLVLVNGIKVNDDDRGHFRFSDGDTLAVWPHSN